MFTQSDTLWSNIYLLDITWLVERQLRVQDLRNQDWRFLLAFLWLALSGPNTLHSHCGIQSWNKVGWVCMRKRISHLIKKYIFPDDDCMKSLIELFSSFLWGSSTFHPTCLVWCSAWRAGGDRNIISVCLVRGGTTDFLLPCRSTLKLCLHFSYIGPAKKSITSSVVVSAGSETSVVISKSFISDCGGA